MFEPPRWPPPPAYDRLLSRLAALVARGGAWRLVAAPVIAADATAFPDRWEATRAGVARVLARLCWHAHLDVVPALDDARAAVPDDHAHLRATTVHFTGLEDGRAWFTLERLGNDDVAGALAHEVGRAAVARLGHEAPPFRSAAAPTPGGDAAAPGDDGPDPVDGTIAAVYLGLGVLAANAALYDRSAGELRGNLVHHEHAIVQVGGLDVDEVAFLLAVQAIVRDDAPAAFATLRPTQRARFEAWCEALDPHEDALRARVGAACALEPVARPAAPRPTHVAALASEDDLRRWNRGHRVYRVPDRPINVGGLVGVPLGLAALVAGLGVAAALGAALVTGAAGWWWFRPAPIDRCSDPACDQVLAAGVDRCPRCGGAISGTIAHRDQRLAMDEALDGGPDDALAADR